MSEIPEVGSHGPLTPVLGRVQSILSEAQTHGDSVAFMLLHSAAISRIDAKHGFVAGDKFANLLSMLLAGKALRKFDIVEIISRDEFLCILRMGASEGIAMLAADRIKTRIGENPIELGTFSELADFSIGIALFPEHGGDAESILKCAKQAQLKARTSVDRVCIYHPEAEDSFDYSLHASRLSQALDQNKLSLHYMPQLSLHNKRISGAESLLRWNDEVLGNVSPFTLVQVAESSGQINRLTQWVITSAIQQVEKFHQVDPDFTVSINVSPSNLLEPDLPYYIDRAIRTWNINPKSIIVEITESAMMSDPNAANAALHQLKSYGLQLSIDDFGTGYSSMYYLAQMPLDELKIDKSFVLDMLQVPNNAKIVRSIMELAHNLELYVVAEGVETEEVMDALEHLKCDHVQGYFIGKAIPAAALIERLRAG